MIELMVVLAILAVVGTLVLPAAARYMGDARDATTRASLARLRDVLGEYWQDRVQLVNGQRVNSLPQPNPNVPQSPARGAYPQLAFLFWNPNYVVPNTTVDFDPVYRVGWRGPYLLNAGTTYTINAAANFLERYGENGDPTVFDGWGRPIVIQNPGLAADGVGQDVRLVSAGPNGIVNIDPTTSTAALQANPSAAGDDVWVSFELR